MRGGGQRPEAGPGGLGASPWGGGAAQCEAGGHGKPLSPVSCSRWGPRGLLLVGGRWGLFNEQGGVSHGRCSHHPLDSGGRVGAASSPLLSWGGWAELGAPPEVGDLGARPHVLMGTPCRFSEVCSSEGV